MDSDLTSNEISYEEGEIPHDDSELYTPLVRPHTSVVPNQSEPLVTDSEEENNGKESLSDSDSSEGRYPTKIRKKALPRQDNNQGIKKKSYDIWSRELQTDVLSTSLVDCNVDMTYNRERDIESYNYNLGKHNNLQQGNNSKSSDLKERQRFSGGKRKHNGAYVETSSQNRHSMNEPEEKKEGFSRNILSLTTTVDSLENEIATDIANKLYEEKEDLILRAIKILGKEAVISIFEETQEIESSGGMLIMNGARRRTPGGVFFHLIKTSDDLPREKINEVFSEDKRAYAKNRKKTANEIKKMRAAKFKEALTKDDFPTLLSQTENAIKEFKAKRMAEESSEVINPPPSPATDGKDGNSDVGDRGHPIVYDDEFLLE
ncbi:hypothetical protein RUM44_010780 [Polyplax serrata]|uniref:Phosphorylated adapter RNA export protein n=1 Tax=Polyplax serrata TaxID=468196 RepID=A0ABR1ANG7_POLSC